MKHVCFPLSGFDKSGGMTVITQIANFYAQAGHRVTVSVPDYFSQPHYLLDPAINIHVIRTYGSRTLRRLCLFFGQFWFLLRRFDVVFATSHNTIFYVALARFCTFLRSTRTISLIQHYEPLRIGQFSSHAPLFKKMAMSMTTLTYAFPLEKIAVSAWIKQQIGRDDIRVIPNGIDTTIFTPQRDRATLNRIGFNYRGIPLKGDFLYKAVYTKLVNSALTFSIMGYATEDLSHFSHAKTSSPATPNEAAAFYNDVDIFLHLSSLEGFGLPPLEAMACGCVVILTDSGGPMEYVVDGYNCLIVKPNPDDILQKIADVLASPELARRLSQNAIDTGKCFSLETMRSRYLDLLK